MRCSSVNDRNVCTCVHWEILYDSLIYGLSITKHFQFIKYVLMTPSTSFDYECLAPKGWQGWGSEYMPTTLQHSLSQ